MIMPRPTKCLWGHKGHCPGGPGHAVQSIAEAASAPTRAHQSNELI